MLKRLATTLWGNFESKEELKKFGILAFIFCGIIAIYWALRPMKDSIFNTIVGLEDWQPYAKGLSLVIIFPIVMLYSKLVDMFPRHKVFYFLTGLYGVIALIMYFCFADPSIGLANTVKSPYRIIGWVWYIWVESFGSLMVALFWAIVTDITSPESAKRGFPLIALFGQVGNMVGPYFLNAKMLGFSNSAPVVGILSGMLFLIGFMFWVFMHVTPANQLKGYRAEGEVEVESEPGFFEGLKLLVTQGYLLGLFLIITIYEVIVTVLDYHFKCSVMNAFTNELEQGSYLASYATMTGVVSTLCVLFGINSIQRILGMRVSLLMLPILTAAAVILIKFNPQSLIIGFWIMVFSKAVNYALNQPTLKQLYIPTSKDTKYKAQAWIEMFGGRFSKASGSFINSFRKPLVSQLGGIDGVARFLMFSSLISFGLVGLWLFVAIYVAATYDKAIKEKRIVC
ncbi:MAG TPA: Npt1/Npt2 family nucleotide transporter [Candidatus Babeliales bacterium]|nr:Npt1/Npt2 family nucleotide transporter [Candidatus Babeliales bacterium]